MLPHPAPYATWCASIRPSFGSPQSLGKFNQEASHGTAADEKNYPRGVEVAKGDSWVEDDVPDDQSLVFNTPRGLVLLTGCGHAGIINTLEYARAFLRTAPVDAAIGGFIFSGPLDEQLDWTADRLKEFQTAQILGAHCTGIESVYHLRRRIGLPELWRWHGWRYLQLERWNSDRAPRAINRMLPIGGQLDQGVVAR
jgi:hypothetical protein